ncbi:MAG: polyphosphate kinase 1 [Candidatus Eisenbacteria bacterium]|uniref:Polyphosphate kinase n=1 Tax=Eiseniibacteriota bacterium TaxID=2212470 RepID=A0A7Y2H149_UNCEI|nr:polyphosphate kinase 1 [Candidatus Eisenbacteria bacterium]
MDSQPKAKAEAEPAPIASEPSSKPEVHKFPDVKRPRTPDLAKSIENPSKDFPLDSEELYLNRELTWLGFNFRVLQEATDKRNPLLERVKFLSIVNSNLDEFVMKRIGGLRQQLGAGVTDLTVDGRTPRQQLEVCWTLITELEKKKHRLFGQIKKELKESDIKIASFDDLNDKDQANLRDYYLENIFPLVTPQATDPAHPFPFVSNLSINLLVSLVHPNEDEEPVFARVKAPLGAGIPRFLRVGDKNVFVTLEQVMAHNLDLLFPDMKILTCELFRVIRNANTETDEERAEDLMQMIESELRERKFAPIVRLEVENGMSDDHRARLAAVLGLSIDRDVFEIRGMLGMRDLMELAMIDKPELHDHPHHPVDPPELAIDRPIFYSIREHGSILVSHPYESFVTSVGRFLQEASRDPKVRAIKMSIYRTSPGSRVVEYLAAAARNGKQVAVVVELKARFDEAANINWAYHLEEAGVHVTYGVVGLKTHCKVVLVVRQDYDGLRRYAHIGTGNYHAGNARIYTDLGLFSCDPDVGHDATELFNYLTTGFKPKRKYKKLLVAPKSLKRALLDRIEREIKGSTAKSPGLIRMKLNALEDVDITRALYEASRAGVRVELVVRDTCRLRPGIPGISENVTVVSVVGRFLEHSRIVYFYNQGKEEFYIGSADAMQRNLEHRVEAMIPVEDKKSREHIREIFDAQIQDQRGAWEMFPSGRYEQRQPDSDEGQQGSQAEQVLMAEGRYRESTRLRKRRPQGLGRRKNS